MTSISAIPRGTPVIHRIRSQSSQFGVGFSDFHPDLSSRAQSRDLLFFRSSDLERCCSMTSISAIPTGTPVIHRTRSQSSQFGVGFRVLGRSLIREKVFPTSTMSRDGGDLADSSLPDQNQMRIHRQQKVLISVDWYQPVVKRKLSKRKTLSA
jgi:hypothetical protein